MNKKNKLFIILLILISIIFSINLSANLSRMSGLGLTIGESDWIVKDPSNVLYNPAYITMYSGLIEVNSFTNTGNVKPFGSAFFRITPKFSLGISIGVPLYTSADLNQFSSGDPDTTSSQFHSRIINYGIVDNNSDITPANGFTVTSTAVAPIDVEEDLGVNKLMLHVGTKFTSAKLGLTIRYTGTSSEAHDEYVDNANPTNSNTTGKLGRNREWGFTIGLIIDEFIFFNEFAIDINFSIPNLLRKDKTTYSSSLKTIIQEISSDKAFTLGGGINGTIETSKFNSLIFRTSFTYEDYSIKQYDSTDMNGDGSFMDPSDTRVIDTYGSDYKTFLFGAADKLKISNVGFIFGAVYFKYAKHYSSAFLRRADSGFNGLYQNAEEITIKETTLPVIIGGEFNLADWLTARISLKKEFLKYRKETKETTDMNDQNKTVQTYSLNEEGDTSLNVGLTISIGNFSIDWFINKLWISDGGLLSSSGVTSNFDNFSTKFSISWKFGGIDTIKKLKKR